MAAAVPKSEIVWEIPYKRLIRGILGWILEIHIISFIIAIDYLKAEFFIFKTSGIGVANLFVTFLMQLMQAHILLLEYFFILWTSKSVTVCTTVQLIFENDFFIMLNHVSPPRIHSKLKINKKFLFYSFPSCLCLFATKKFPLANAKN